MNRVLFFCLSLSVVPLLSAQETQLVIPRSSAEMLKLMDDHDALCSACGVVSNIRETLADGQGGSALNRGHIDPPGDSGPSDDVGTVPILSKNKKSGGVTLLPDQRWQVTVRYDDGAFAAFEQDDQPSVHVGDRVQVVSGRVLHR